MKEARHSPAPVPNGCHAQLVLHGFIAHVFLLKLASKMTIDFSTPSERAHFKLPENVYNVENGQSKPKLWPFKDA